MATDREMFEKVWKMDVNDFINTLFKIEKQLGICNMKELPKTKEEMHNYMKAHNWVVLGNIEDGMPTEKNGYKECKPGSMLDMTIFGTNGPETWKGMSMSKSSLSYLASMHFDGWVDLFNHYDKRLIPAFKKEFKMELTPEEKKLLGSEMKR